MPLFREGRREFLRQAAWGMACAMTGAGTMHLAQAETRTDAVPMPPFGYWMHGFSEDDPRGTAAALKDAGFGVVVAGGAPVIEAVTDAGMQSWLCGGGFPLVRDDADVKSVDILGAAQTWFGSGSPNCPEVRDASLRSYESMVKTPGITGILVDGCRFASPASGLMPFLTDFSRHSREKAAVLGYDFEAMRRDVKALYDQLTGTPADSRRVPSWIQMPSGILEWLIRHPGILEWFRFRRACVTEHFRALSEIIHGAGLRMGVYIFTPSLAPLVGQSYTDLAAFVDVFAPMIYRNYAERPGIACLNWELAILPEELGWEGSPEEQPVMRTILGFVGMSDLPVEARVAAVRTSLPPESVGRETVRARERIGRDRQLAPIIYIDDPEMERTARLVRNAGANGLNFFVFNREWQAMTAAARV